MTLRAALVILALATQAHSASHDARSLLAKASAAFERNSLQEVHWNWVTKEKRVITGKDGQVVQPLPTVTIESVIRKDGKRCTAVLDWSDGVEAYLKDADPDSRCQATEQKAVLEIPFLLRSSRVKFVSESAAEVVLSITPDKEKLQSPVLEERCAASIRATLMLDPATFFPRRIEGSVLDTGCDLQHPASVYYDEPANLPSVRASIHKGTSFRFEYELQKDKFEAGDRNFWVRARQHTDVLRWVQGGLFISWGRKFNIPPDGAPQHIVEDIETTAQEFGAQSTVR